MSGLQKSSTALVFVAAADLSLPPTPLLCPYSCLCDAFSAQADNSTCVACYLIVTLDP